MNTCLFLKKTTFIYCLYGLLLCCTLSTNIYANITTDTLLAGNYEKEGRLLAKGKDYESAITCYEEALFIYQQYPPLFIQTATLYDRIGIARRKQNQLTTALSSFKKGIDILTSHNHKQQLYGEISQRVGNMYIELGDFLSAEQWLLHALQIFKTQHISHKIPEPYINLANLATQQGDMAQAEQYYQKALQCNLDTTLQIALYNNIVSLYVTQNNTQKAIQTAQKALQLQEAITKNIATENTIRIYLTLAELYSQQKQYTEAHKWLNKAYNTYHQTANPKSLISKKVHNAIANYYTHTQQLDSALYYTQKAIVALIPTFNQQAIAQNPNPQQLYPEPELIDLLEKKANLLDQYASQNNAPIANTYLQNALQTYQLAIQQLQLLLHTYQQDNAKIDLITYNNSLFEKAIIAAIKQQKHDIAWQIACQAKAVVLLSEWQKQKAIQLANVPDSICQKEKNAYMNITELQLKQFQCFKPNTIDSIAAQQYSDSLLFAQQYLEKTLTQIEKEYPNYYYLKYTAQKIPTLKQLQTQIKPHQLVVEYFAGDSTLYAFAITNQHLKIYTIPHIDTLQKIFQQYHKTITDDDYIKQIGSTAKSTYLQTATYLYNTLLKPAIDYHTITHSNKIQSITIVPDAWIGYISFAALLTKPYPTWSDANVPYLVKQFNLTYNYSSQFIALPHIYNNNQQHTFSYLYGGMGLEYNDYTLQQAIKQLGGDSLQLNKKILAKLPQAPIEIDAIYQLLGGKTWLNEQATKKNLVHNINQCKIWHIAAHGYINEDNPLESAIILNKDTDTTDHFLKAADIYQLQVHTNLVVLSACNTGNGQLQRGEGIMSLARAFAYSGCPSLLMNLWSIPDRSTSEIMHLFYEQLKQGTTKDIALQKAQTTYLQKKTNSPEYYKPFYWAAPILVGNTDAITKTAWLSNNWLYLLLAFVGLLFILLLLSKNTNTIKV